MALLSQPIHSELFLKFKGPCESWGNEIEVEIVILRSCQMNICRAINYICIAQVKTICFHSQVLGKTYLSCTNSQICESKGVFNLDVQFLLSRIRDQHVEILPESKINHPWWQFFRTLDEDYISLLNSSFILLN